MEQFSLEKYLENPSRKVVTRDGRIVEILKVDAKGNHPIIGVYQFSDTEDMESSWRIDGRKNENYDSSFDLFFMDDELTEFEKQLGVYIYYPRLSSGFNMEEKNYIRDAANTLINLARKEIEKENSYSGNQKQEWSEKDRDMLDNCLGLIQEIDSTQEEQNWLKSIKPNHWKPSEEQLIDLYYAAKQLSETRPNLQILYNDIKQL